MIEAGVGFSTNSNSLQAGKEAVQKALKQLSGANPKLAIVAIDLSAAAIYNIEDVLKGIKSEIPYVPLIGGGSIGVIVNDDVAIRAVGIMLLAGDFNVIKPRIWTHTRVDHEKVGREMIQEYKPLIGKAQNEVMLLFTSGYRIPPEVLAQQKRFDSFGARVFSSLVSRIFWSNMRSFAEEGKGFPITQELIEYLVSNKLNVPIVGTQCGDTSGIRTFEFFNETVNYDSVISCLLSSDQIKFSVGYDLGVRGTGKKMKITKNVGPFLLGINNKKALEGLLEVTGYERESLNELSYQGYINFLSLVGLADEDGVHPYVAVTDPQYDSIFTVLPPKMVEKKLELEICEATGEKILESARNAVRQAMQQIDDPKFLLFFDCSARITMLGDRILDEIKIIREEVGKDIPIFGFGSSGEIKDAKPGGYHLNNLSIVVLIGGS